MKASNEKAHRLPPAATVERKGTMENTETIERKSGAAVLVQRMVSQPSTVCAICGKSEDEHHAFVPVMRPAGCKCNVKDWRRNHEIPPVCNHYEKGDCGYYCKNCEHDPECHAG